MSNIEDLLPGLETILSSLVDAHERVLEAGRNMNAALKNKQLDQVKLQNDRYDTYVGHIEELEQQRLELCDKAASIAGKRHITIASIIDFLDDNKRLPFLRYRRLLKEKIAEISKINASNYVLLQASLSAIAKNVEIIAGGQEKYNGYGQGGAKTSEKTTHSIFNKIA